MHTATSPRWRDSCSYCLHRLLGGCLRSLPCLEPLCANTISHTTRCSCFSVSPSSHHPTESFSVQRPRLPRPTKMGLTSCLLQIPSQDNNDAHHLLLDLQIQHPIILGHLRFSAYPCLDGSPRIGTGWGQLARSKRQMRRLLISMLCIRFFRIVIILRDHKCVSDRKQNPTSYRPLHVS